MTNETRKKFDAITKLIADGESVRNAAKKVGMNPTYFYELKRKQLNLPAKVKVYETPKKQKIAAISVSKERPVILVYPSQLKEVLAQL